MTILTKALLALVAALLMVVGIQTYRVHAHQNDAVEAAVAPAKEAAAQAKAQAETVMVKLADARVVVTRTIHDTVSVPANVLHPVTAADTTSAVAALPIVKAERDSIARSCAAYVLTCDLFRASAETRFRADSSVIAAQDALLTSRPPRRHWSLGVTGGYGAVLSAGRVLTGPSLTAGVTWSPF